MKERWQEMLEYQQKVQAMTEFRDLVRAMRAAQKEYFRCREREVLVRSKRLEKEVDAALQEEPA